MKHLLSIIPAGLAVALLCCTSCSGGKGDNTDKNGKQLADSVYVAGMEKIPGTLFLGADGYDYYVAPVFADSLFTFNEALALEKDGWVLPKSLGYFAISWSGGVYGQRMEYETIHTESDDPVIERMVGSPRLLVKVLPDLSFQHIVGYGEFWTATPLNAGNAVYYTVRQQYNGTQMSSITDTGAPKSERKRVVLVKRIPHPADAFYLNPVDNRKFPSRSIGNFEVVDPSGGLNLTFHTPVTAYGSTAYDFPNGVHLISDYEQDGWKLPDYQDLSSIFNVALEPTGAAITTTCSPMLRRMFPPSEYLGRDSEGAYFIYSITYPHDAQIRILPGRAPVGSGARVRLVRHAGNPAKAESESPSAEESAPVHASDSNLLGLKGPVESATYRREGADEPYLTAMFDSYGRLISPPQVKISRDDQGRIIAYEQYVGPDNEDNYEYTFTYQEGSDSPENYHFSSWSSNSSGMISYGSNGEITNVETEAYYEGEEGIYKITRAYTILENDRNGNWIRRRVEEESIAEYQTEDESGEYQPAQQVISDTYIEIRTIKYRPG